MNKTASKTIRRLWLGAALVASGALAGCGFTPLYATSGLAPALSSVEVVTPQDREGYLLRDRLRDELARDTDTPPLYRLTITDVETRYPLGQRINNVATRYELGLTARYVLSDAVTGRVLLSGSAPVQVSYPSADPPFAGTAASQDGEVRAAGQAAIRIRLDLSRYFARQSQPLDATPAPPPAPEPAMAPALLGPPQTRDEPVQTPNTGPSVP